MFLFVRRENTGVERAMTDSIVKYLNLEPNEIQQIMKNKITWRKFVSAASTIPSKDDT